MSAVAVGPVRDASRLIDVDSGDGHHAQLAVFVPEQARHGVLWIPAMGVPARKYETFAAAMAAAGVAVALHEWRGAERSNWRAKSHDWSYRELLADIAASRTALARECPAIEWHVGGHSLGAQLGALAMAENPGAYRSLVVVGSGQPWWRSFPTMQRPFLLGVFAFFRGLSALFGYFPGDKVGFGAQEARGVIRDWTRSGMTGGYGDALDRKLATLTCPLIAIRFRDDWYVPPGSLDHLRAKLPNAKATVTVLGPRDFAKGKADHFAWMRDPAAVVTVLAPALEGTP